MTDEEWFDAYDGPKVLGWCGGGFACSIGFNTETAAGVSGEMISAEAETPQGAIAEVRRRFAAAFPA